jgi:hypothetical protein
MEKVSILPLENAYVEGKLYFMDNPVTKTFMNRPHIVVIELVFGPSYNHPTRQVHWRYFLAKRV